LNGGAFCFAEFCTNAPGPIQLQHSYQEGQRTDPSSPQLPSQGVN
jgi:hypothetical protein